jgi:hypothetical protein
MISESRIDPLSAPLEKIVGLAISGIFASVWRNFQKDFSAPL